MSQQPQRPFVPRRTPKTARPTIAASEFRLYRPFLPGSQREPVGSIDLPSAIEAQQSNSATLRPIEDFLATAPTPRAPRYAQEKNEPANTRESDDELFELPPVEHFLDPLPVVEQFAPDSEGALSDAWPAANDPVPSAGTRAPDPSESGWAETDWQSFDWRAAAALGEGPEAEASSAWASTDWDGTASPPRDSKPTAAQAIAQALDQIAQQIREGELAVPGSATAPTAATIAATLAALMGVKR